MSGEEVIVTRNTIPAIENNQTDKSQATSSPTESWAPVTMRPLAFAAREKALFEDSLLDSTVGQRKRRTWSTVFSIPSSSRTFIRSPNGVAEPTEQPRFIGTFCSRATSHRAPAGRIDFFRSQS